VESEDQPIDAALAAWERLRPLLAAACAHSGRRLAYRQPEEFGVLIREKEPPRALRLEYSPERKKLRYKAGASGCRSWTRSSVRRSRRRSRPRTTRSTASKRSAISSSQSSKNRRFDRFEAAGVGHYLSTVDLSPQEGRLPT